MKKNIFIFFIIFFLSGCTVEYDLVLKNKISEKIIGTTNSYEEFEMNKFSKIKALYSQARIAYDSLPENSEIEFEYYNSKELKDIYTIEYSYDFNIDNYYDSNAANTCYDYFKVNKNGDIVTISTSNSFNCFNYYKELEKVTVNIISHYGVVQSNSDKVNGKKHTWEITPNNAENKPIIFVYDESKKNITLLDYIKENYILFIIIGIFTIGVPIFLLIRIRSKKVNKI